MHQPALRFDEAAKYARSIFFWRIFGGSRAAAARVERDFFGGRYGKKLLAGRLEGGRRVGDLNCLESMQRRSQARVGRSQHRTYSQA